MGVTFASTTISSLKVFYSSLDLNWGCFPSQVFTGGDLFRLFHEHVSLHKNLTAAGSPGRGPHQQPTHTHTLLHTTCVGATHDVTEYKSWVPELRVTTPGEHLLKMCISKTGFYVTASGGDVGEIA